MKTEYKGYTIEFRKTRKGKWYCVIWGKDHYNTWNTVDTLEKAKKLIDIWER